MRWISKKDVIVLLFLLFGFPALALLAAVVTPTIVYIKQGNI